MSPVLLQGLIFRVFRMLLILTGVIGAMAVIFPLIQEMNAPSQVRPAPSAPPPH